MKTTPNLNDHGPDDLNASGPSWLAERHVLMQYGDRTSRGILAIYHARRSAKRIEFFVSPRLARYYRLSPQALNWVFCRLDGKLIESIKSLSGKYRRIRLLPEFEAGIRRSAPGKANSLYGLWDETRVRVDRDEVLKAASKFNR